MSSHCNKKLDNTPEKAVWDNGVRFIDSHLGEIKRVNFPSTGWSNALNVATSASHRFNDGSVVLEWAVEPE